MLAIVEDEESMWAARVNEPGSYGYGRIVSEHRAAGVVVRQWAGHDAAIAARESQLAVH